MPPTPIALLTIGMKGSATGPFPAAQIQAAMQAATASAPARGYDLTVHTLDLVIPEAGTNKEPPSHITRLQEIKTILDSKPWDCVIIGGGLRGNNALVPFFEKLVNTVVDEVKPTPKFGFSTSPGSVLEAADRVCRGTEAR